MDRLCFNQISHYHLDLAASLELYHRHNVKWVSLWHEKIEETGVDRVKKLLETYGMRPNSICGWFKRPRAGITIEERLHTFEIAAEIGAQAVTVIVPGMQAFNTSLGESRKRGFDYVARMLEAGRCHHVRLSLEPIHPKLIGALSCLNSLAQALDWCEQLGEGIGVEFDVNNVWWDPDLEQQIIRAQAKNLISGVQLCDVPPDVPVSERAGLGEGIVDLCHFVRCFEDAGYKGLYEMELINPALWQRDVDDDTAQTITAYRQLTARHP